MRIKPNERQQITEICREEFEDSIRRISERLSLFECRSDSSAGDKFEGVRLFYEDLVDKAWTDADEEALSNFRDMSEDEIKRMMREAFRRSPIYPVPNFQFLINVLKKQEGEAIAEVSASINKSDAVSAVDRERIANVLHNELAEAAQEIASRLRLGERAEIVREQLERVEGNIISRFSPLV